MSRVPSTELHPVWRNALDRAMDVDLAMELARVLTSTAERDLILVAHTEPEEVAQACHLIDSAGELIWERDRDLALRLLTVYAALTLIGGDTLAAEANSANVLMFQPANRMARLVNLAAKNGVPMSMAEMPEADLTKLLDTVAQQRLTTEA